MSRLCLLLVAEDVEGSDQQRHMYGIHSNARNCHANEVIDEKNVSLSVLNASQADDDNRDASCNIPRSPQVQSYAEL
jgi:hypothetical protein